MIKGNFGVGADGADFGEDKRPKRTLTHKVFPGMRWWELMEQITRIESQSVSPKRVLFFVEKEAIGLVIKFMIIEAFLALVFGIFSNEISNSICCKTKRIIAAQSE